MSWTLRVYLPEETRFNACRASLWLTRIAKLDLPTHCPQEAKNVAVTVAASQSLMQNKPPFSHCNTTWATPRTTPRTTPDFFTHATQRVATMAGRADGGQMEAP